MLRFTIRDILWLTVVAAIVIAWGLDGARLNSQLRELQAATGAPHPKNLRVISLRALHDSLARPKPAESTSPFQFEIPLD
jgi:hypothetical protein